MSNIPTSPTLPTHDGIVYSPKEFSDNLTLDLTDDEISQAMKAILDVRTKYSRIFRSKFGPHGGFTVEDAMKSLDEFEQELKDRLAQQDLLVSVDVEPVLFGEPPIITLEGNMTSHISASYGLDHERKTYEVKKSKELGQPFLGADKVE
jgi:hypothetical protein